MLRESKVSEDKEFKEFQTILVAAGVVESQGQDIPSSSVPSSRKSLDDLFAPIQPLKNKKGTFSKKNTSLTMVSPLISIGVSYKKKRKTRSGWRKK